MKGEGYVHHNLLASQKQEEDHDSRQNIGKDMQADTQLYITLPPHGEGDYQTRYKYGGKVKELPDMLKGKKQGADDRRPRFEP